MLLRRIAVLALVLAATLPIAPASADGYQDALRLHRQGERDAALEQLERHLARQPRDARARFLKGVILTEQNRRPEALDVFTALTQDFPELPEPYNNLAVLYAGQGNYERAREALQMAIRTHPGYATAHENLGDVYAAMSRAAYEQALVRDPQSQTARTKLMLIGELVPARKDAPPAPAADQAGATGAVVQAAPSGDDTPPEGDALPAPAQAAGTAAEPMVNDGEIDSTPSSPALVAPETAQAEPPRPAPAPDPAEAPQPVPTQERVQAVQRMVQDWAAAWSRGDADAYLAHYAPGFRTPKGEPRARWEAARRADMARLKDVSVKVIEPKVAFRDAQRATVTFAQEYASATAKVSGRKTLELVRQGERWLIEQETIVRR